MKKYCILIHSYKLKLRKNKLLGKISCALFKAILKPSIISTGERPFNKNDQKLRLNFILSVVELPY